MNILAKVANTYRLCEDLLEPYQTILPPDIFLKILTSGNPEINFVQSRYLAEAIVKTEVIKNLVKLLNLGVSKNKEPAAWVLGCLADMNQGKQKEIVEAGGIEPLVNLLEKGTIRQKTEAARALKNLSHDNPNIKRAIKNRLDKLKSARIAKSYEAMRIKKDLLANFII